MGGSSVGGESSTIRGPLFRGGSLDPQPTILAADEVRRVAIAVAGSARVAALLRTGKGAPRR
jgi:hypothetical protein